MWLKLLAETWLNHPAITTLATPVLGSDTVVHLHVSSCRFLGAAQTQQLQVQSRLAELARSAGCSEAASWGPGAVMFVPPVD